MLLKLPGGFVDFDYFHIEDVISKRMSDPQQAYSKKGTPGNGIFLHPFFIDLNTNSWFFRKSNKTVLYPFSIYFMISLNIGSYENKIAIQGSGKLRY